MEHYVIGIINPLTSPDDRTIGFIESMAGSGYEEGKNITYVKYEGWINPDTALDDLIERDVDIILTVTIPATQKAIEAVEDTNIPVVFIVYDAVNCGLAEKHSQSGGNFTGVQTRGSAPMAVQWLLTINSEVEQIYMPVKFDTPAAELSLKDIKEGTEEFGIKFTASEVNTMEELDKFLDSIPDNVDAIFILSNLSKVIEAAAKRKLLTFSAIEKYNEGVLISYGAEDITTRKQAGRLAKMILQGIPATDIPIETGNFFLGVTLKTAEALGVNIKNEILQSADNIKW